MIAYSLKVLFTGERGRALLKCAFIQFSIFYHKFFCSNSVVLRAVFFGENGTFLLKTPVAELFEICVI